VTASNARREVHPHRDFGFSLGENVFSDFGRSLLRALPHVDAAFILELDVRNTVAEVDALGSGSGGIRFRCLRRQ
jgi:hypothetical protein